MNLDLGCGSNKHTGFIGIDRRKAKGVDIVHDINDGIPLDDNVVDLVIASHILEHIPDTMKIMAEIWRVCKHGAQVAIAVPHYRSIGAWLDPTHVRAFTERTFDYWDSRTALYHIYKPKEVFFIESLAWTAMGNIETVLRVHKEQPKKYHKTKEAVLKEEGCEKAINSRKRKTKSKRKKKKVANKSL